MGKSAKEKEKSKDHDKAKKEKKKEKGADGKTKAPTPADVAMDHRKLFKEGQKHLTPPVADPTRGFYESLYKENEKSRVAIKFCVEHGIFALDLHKKVFKKYMAMKA